MTNQHPITPPPELVDQWYNECHKQNEPFTLYMTTQAAQWGADQELEACCEWLKQELQQPGWANRISSYFLYAARRPKPLTLKEQALSLIPEVCGLPMMRTYSPDELLILRRALEALPND